MPILLAGGARLHDRRAVVQQYAYHNRRVRKEIMLEIMYEVTKCQADLNEAVSIPHNYCSCEDCGGGR